MKTLLRNTLSMKKRTNSRPLIIKSPQHQWNKYEVRIENTNNSLVRNRIVSTVQSTVLTYYISMACLSLKVKKIKMEHFIIVSVSSVFSTGATGATGAMLPGAQKKEFNQLLKKNDLFAIL